MTLSELQTVRAAVYASYLATLTAGVEQYSIGGGGASRSVTRVKSADLLNQLNELDRAIARLQGSAVSVGQFRRPE